MEAFTIDVYESLTNALEKIDLESKNVIQRSLYAYQAAKEASEKVNDFMLRYTFANQEEEILFYKSIKPKFLRELIYYAELYHIEAGRPAAGEKSTQQYLKGLLTIIRMYFDRNKEFYNYWRSGKTNLDHVYFVHSKVGDIPPQYATDLDPSGYPGCYCFKLARLQALENIKCYIEQPMGSREECVLPADPAVRSLPLEWTDSKSSLIELVYAIQTKGAVNNGNIDLKQLMTAFEQFFHVNTGNYYGVFQQNIRIRKKNRTQYLDQLKDRLEKRMDDEDEHPRF